MGRFRNGHDCDGPCCNPPDEPSFGVDGEGEPIPPKKINGHMLGRLKKSLNRNLSLSGKRKGDLMDLINAWAARENEL